MPEASQRTTEVPVTRKRKCLAVAPRDRDLVADRDVAEESEMGVAVGGVDRGAALAGLRRALDLPGPEGERLPARAGEHDRALRRRGTSTRATGQVSAQDHGLTSGRSPSVAANARSSRTCASTALAWIQTPWPTSDERRDGHRSTGEVGERRDADRGSSRRSPHAIA